MLESMREERGAQPGQARSRGVGQQTHTLTTEGAHCAPRRERVGPSAPPLPPPQVLQHHRVDQCLPDAVQASWWLCVGGRAGVPAESALQGASHDVAGVFFPT